MQIPAWPLRLSMIGRPGSHGRKAARHGVSLKRVDQATRLPGNVAGSASALAAVQHRSTATHPGARGRAGTRVDGDLHGETRVDVLPPGRQEVSSSSPLSSTSGCSAVQSLAELKGLPPARWGPARCPRRLAFLLLRVTGLRRSIVSACVFRKCCALLHPGPVFQRSRCSARSKDRVRGRRLGYLVLQQTTESYRLLACGPGRAAMPARAFAARCLP